MSGSHACGPGGCGAHTWGRGGAHRRAMPGGVGLAALLVLLTGGWSGVVAVGRELGVTTDAPDGPARVVEGITHGSRWLVDLGDGTATSLPLALRPVLATGYAVSPNGRRVAFTAPDGEGTSRVYLAAMDGTDLRPLTPAGVAADAPAWSPDGSAIAYVDDEGLGVMDLASGRIRRFAHLPTGSIDQPSFRSDGRRILFTRTYGPHGARSALWTVPARGGRARLLLERATAGAWSPDGASLIFRRRDNEHAIEVLREAGYWNPFQVDGQHGLWLADAHGHPRHRIGAWTTAAWGPDSRHLVVVGDDRIVHVLDMKTGRNDDVACGWSASWWDMDRVLVEGYEPDCDRLVIR